MPHPVVKRLILPAALLIALAASLVCLKYVYTKPWLGIFAIWTLLFVVLTFISPKGKKALFFNLGCLFVALLAMEYFLARGENRPKSQRKTVQKVGTAFQKGYFIADENMGYAPPANQTFSAMKKIDERILFNVKYTIDKDRLRATPEAEGKPEILFFGGSFVFGEGLQNEGSLPWQVSEQLNQEFKTRNYGFHGYGPQQMLYALESGQVKDTSKASVIHVVYCPIIDHLKRGLGRRPWSKASARYVMVDGVPQHKSNWVKHEASLAPTGLKKTLLNQGQKSSIYRFLTKQKAAGTSDADYIMFAAMVGKARDLVHKEWPDATFHVLFWNNQSEEGTRILDSMTALDLKVMQADLIIAEKISYEESRLPGDNHPSAEGNRVLAEHLVNEVF